jgi:putative flippase GtrA
VTRFARFNVVGLLGFGVQLAVLLLLERAGWPVVLATIVAVEAAVLHNFVWHEWWTWSDVRAGSRTSRLIRFHAANGLISLAGNAVITTALTQAGAPVALANGMAVGTCAIANFAAAHLLVFCAKTWPTFHGHLQ